MNGVMAWRKCGGCGMLLPSEEVAPYHGTGPRFGRFEAQLCRKCRAARDLDAESWRAFDMTQEQLVIEAERRTYEIAQRIRKGAGR